MLQGGTTTSEMQATTLPELPSREVGRLLLETVYLYIQARYCIVDWVRLREWHQRRETICYSTKEDDLDTQTGRDPLTRGILLKTQRAAHSILGAYFVWIIYAIGAGFVPNPEYPPKVLLSNARLLIHTHSLWMFRPISRVHSSICTQS